MMTRAKPAVPAPADTPLPLPGEGGAWVRLQDGSLVREGGAPVQGPDELPVKEA